MHFKVEKDIYLPLSVAKDMMPSIQDAGDARDKIFDLDQLAGCFERSTDKCHPPSLHIAWRILAFKRQHISNNTMLLENGFIISRNSKAIECTNFQIQAPRRMLQRDT